MSIWPLLDKVLREYNAKYSLIDVPINVDELRLILEPLSKVDRMYYEEIECDTEHVLASVMFYTAGLGLYSGKGTYARIQYVRNLNLCWKRFAVCKEMYQCVLDDTNEKRTNSTVRFLAVVDRLSSDFYEVLADENDAEVDVRQAYSTELIAELFALETLFPYELRRKFFDAYDEHKITDYQLAYRFKIPEEMVNFCMKNDTYSSSVQRGRDLIDCI